MIDCGARRRRAPTAGLLLGTCLSTLALAPVAVLAQSATWSATPLNGTFGNSANWVGGTVPANTATFGASTITSITTLSRAIDILQFNAGAPSYSFTNSGTLQLTGGGIVNNSSNAPTITNGIFLFVENGSTTGNAIITNNGGTTFSETSTAGTSAITSNGGSTLSFADNSSANSATITSNGGLVQFTSSASAGSSTITINGAGGQLKFSDSTTANSARIIANAGTVDLSGMTSNLSIGSIEGAANITLGGSQVTVGGLNLSTTLSGTISGGGGTMLVKAGTGTLTLTGANTYAGGTTINGGLINFAAANNFGTGAITLNGGGLQWATGNTTDISSRLAPLGAAGGVFDTNGNNVTLATGITGSGGLTKQGAGTLTLGGVSSYSGPTAVTMGTLQAGAANVLAPNSAYTVSGGVTLSLNGFNQTIGSLAGSGNVTLGSATLTTGNDNTSTTFSGVTSGTGGLTKIGTGTLTLGGNNTFSGGTILNAGGLVVAGSLASGVTNNGGALQVSGSVTGNVVQNSGSTSLTGNLSGGFSLNGGTASLNGTVSGAVIASGGTLGGNGTVGSLTVAGATLAPGNSIGTINVAGNFVQSAGVYQVEVNNAGQSDKVNVGGTAAISNSSVSVLAQSGNYARNTTYTILTAAGGVTGTYSGVTSNFAFLTPSLSYDANNVYLSLLQNQSAFAAGAQTANQYAVGAVLDQANATATGDLNTVLNALSVLGTQQGPYVLNQISGQPYADFGTFNVANNALFMNALGQQMAVARGVPGTGQRQALAQACEVEGCDGASPFSVWGSVLGGVGSAQGNGNSQTFTYNVGGAAAGIDYRVSPSLLFGIGTGYTNGTQWVDSFQGKGWSNTVSVAAYGSFMPLGPLGGAYVDALAGYAYSNNQMQRQLSIPGLQPRTANGSTGANQFLGQVETGYAFGVYAPANATVTPFARFQASSINQAAFQEWGANSLSLNVAQQTTTSLRTTLGAQFDGAIGSVALGLRLGWLHEYADTSRPLTAAFAGAPTTSFTVYGAAPQRDAAVIGFQANSRVADNASIYLRYDGDIGSGADNHALNVGLRLSW
ncbi:MAG: autotransporter domain-containing protein [Reyranella sp.]|nr:autotransporter domain-containing protein [Reyranella sp.]